MSVLSADQATKISLLEALLEQAEESGHSVPEPELETVLRWWLHTCLCMQQ